MRLLIAAWLCVTFNGVQQHVVRSDRDAALQGAAHQKDGSPEHDWRRAGDGTTRALQTHLSAEAAVLPASAPAAVATALATPGFSVPDAARCAPPGEPARPLRI